MAKSGKKSKGGKDVTDNKCKRNKSKFKRCGKPNLEATRLLETSSIPSSTTAVRVSEPDSDSDLGPEDIREVLEPYSKSQIIDLICSTLQKRSLLLSRLREEADRDPCHRNVFVHGLAWDARRETVMPAFEKYGEIEECNVIMDKATGRSKGYAFVLFKTRKGARNALKEPQKRILNRTAWCQLASVGPPAAGKKTLEITGPVKINLDQVTTNDGQIQDRGQILGQGQSQVLGQNLDMLGQNQGLNVLLGGLLGNPMLINPLLSSALEQGVVSPGLVPPGHMAGVGGLGGANCQSVLHPYVLSSMLQNQHGCSQIGQIADPRGRADV